MDISKLGIPDIEIAALKIWVHGLDSHDGWLCVTVHCASEGASVRLHDSILHLDELAVFLPECNRLYQTLQGRAELSCMEPNLRVELAISNSRGGIEVQIQITPDHLNQEHLFRFSIDQSYLPGIIEGLSTVLAKFPIRGRP